MTTLKLSFVVLKLCTFSIFTSYLLSTDHSKTQLPNADLVFTEPDPFCSLDAVNCTADVSYPFSVIPDIENGLQVTYQLKLNGGSPEADTFGAISHTNLDYNIEGTYPIGDHHFLVTVEEMDGTIITAELPFSVVDCLAPVPNCINGLAIEFLTYPTIVYVEDLLATPSNDCTEPVTYSINILGEPVDRNQDSLVITCCMPQTFIVEIWAWDNANNPYATQPDGTVSGPNHNFCETYILNQFFYECCYPYEFVNISGTIYTINLNGLEGVEVNLSGDANAQVFSDSEGQYTFEDIETDGDYSIVPVFDESPLNGVTTLDMVITAKHILNIATLDSPYKIIAADVNNSGSVTTLDMIQTRKVILGVQDEFPNNTSWRFVDASYVFPDPNNPWAEAFPEVSNINNIDDDLMDIDFVAIKTGDVNGSAE